MTDAERADLYKRQRDKAVEALEPFASFASDNVDESGWTGREQNARIVTWFGPSDFRRARQTIAEIEEEADGTR